LNKTKKIRTAVIGLGVGAHQARTLSKHPSCQLDWICDFDKDRLSKIGLEFPETKQTQNDQDILNDPNVDLICIASHDKFHYTQVITALNQGKHVYVEKPICLRKSEIQDIFKLLKKHSKLRLSSNMVLRTCPLFMKVREAVQNHQMGKIYHLEADYLWGRKEKIISGWRAEADLYSIIYGAAVHMIDLVLWITGKRPISVQALGNNIVTANTLQKNNDFAVILLKFENKMSVKISAHGGCMHPHFHSLKVFGSESSFIHESTGTIWINSSDPNQKFISETSEYPAKTKRDGTLISFLNSLMNFDENPLVPEKEVFDTMSICFGAEQSIKTGQIVDIEYL
tara:strand:- start:284 stop:1303 length:1020 start_codon:yes stop_codon:yes gene_type:complete